MTDGTSRWVEGLHQRLPVIPFEMLQARFHRVQQHHRGGQKNMFWTMLAGGHCSYGVFPVFKGIISLAFPSIELY